MRGTSGSSRPQHMPMSRYQLVSGAPAGRCCPLHLMPSHPRTPTEHPCSHTSHAHLPCIISLPSWRPRPQSAPNSRARCPVAASICMVWRRAPVRSTYAYAIALRPPRALCGSRAYARAALARGWVGAWRCRGPESGGEDKRFRMRFAQQRSGYPTTGVWVLAGRLSGVRGGKPTDIICDVFGVRNANRPGDTNVLRADFDRDRRTPPTGLAAARAGSCVRKTMRRHGVRLCSSRLAPARRRRQQTPERRVLHGRLRQEGAFTRQLS